jgi:two-component system, OmpR family, sensor kinase
MIDRMSLRARLVLGVVVLAAAGLLVADAATYALLKSNLVQRVDRTLDDDEHAVLDRRGHEGPGNIPPDLFVQVRSLDGSSVLQTVPTPAFGDEQPPTPELPSRIDVSAPSDGAHDSVRHFTVGGQDGGEYRVRASIDQGADGMLVLATSLADVNNTLRQLLMIELLVTAIVLAALAAGGLWVVRLGLKPLDAIGTTAAAIAAGDLTRRVERAEDRTEVGRLGLALNAMLGQIETAFRAREASERKLRRFVADASHELRTPLAAVRAYAELFTRGASTRPDDLERSMTGISRESERMSVLVDDLLLLARLDEGRPLEQEPVALDEVVSEAVETAQTLEPARPIELAVDEAVVTGDRVRLRQIVDNLLSNVRAHTPPATPVRVSLSRVNGNAAIEVADAGPGLGDQEMAHVFERFYRADPSRARASGGVGLGLSIVAAVAEAHGGSVSAASSPGGGATFRIELPLRS